LFATTEWAKSEKDIGRIVVPSPQLGCIALQKVGFLTFPSLTMPKWLGTDSLTHLFF